MRINPSSRSGLTLVELSITSGWLGVLGLVIYSLLNVGAVLGAKNTAMNTAHQQARVAMLKMIEDLHSAVSLPALKGAQGTQASGISFQQWGSAPLNGVMTSNGGPHKIKFDAATGQNAITLAISAGQPMPVVGQRLIVPTHQIEDDIIGVTGGLNNCRLELANNLRTAINGTGSTIGDVVGYITDRCSYDVAEVLDASGNSRVPAEYKLQWTTTQGTRDVVNSITNPRPFSIPATPAGALYYRFVAAIDLSTSDSKHTNRGYRSANILLNGQVPYKARLTTYQ